MEEISYKGEEVYRQVLMCVEATPLGPAACIREVAGSVEQTLQNLSHEYYC